MVDIVESLVGKQKLFFADLGGILSEESLKKGDLFVGDVAALPKFGDLLSGKLAHINIDGLLYSNELSHN